MSTKFFQSFDTVRDRVFNSGIGATKLLADPYLGGYSFIKIIPDAILSNEMGLHATFFELLEKTFKEVGGLPRIEMGTTSIQGGFTANEHVFPSEITKNISELTLKFQEFSGSPYTKQFRQWVESIRNPETGLYSLSQYGLKYYSVSILYINTSPAIGSHFAETRRNSIEFAGLLTGAYPKSIDYDKYNFTSGDHSTNELDQAFACNFHVGEVITKRAEDYVGSEAFYNNMKLASQNIYDGLGGILYKNALVPDNDGGAAPEVNANVTTIVVPEF